MIYTLKIVKRRLGSPPDTLLLSWLRHEVTLAEMEWLRLALWSLFAIDATSDDEAVVRSLTASFGKFRTVQFLLWWHDSFGDKATLQHMQASGFAEHFDNSGD